MIDKDTILIIDQFHPQVLLELEEHFEVNFKPEITRKQLLVEIKNADILIISTRIIIDSELIAAAKRCRLLIRLGSGVDHIDLSACNDASITVCNTPRANIAAVVEIVFGQIIRWYRNLETMQASVIDHSFRNGISKGFELDRKRIGIIGVGRIGSAVSRVASAFGMTTVGYDPFLNQSQRIERDIDEWVSSNEELIGSVDIVTLHVPLTDKTLNLADSSFFRNMKPASLFINTARGKCVRISDLFSALENDYIAAAILDVFPSEPFIEMIPGSIERRLLLSPHAGAFTREALFKRSEECVKEINEFYEGNTPHGTIDPIKGY
jgi:D-3-phosphoglycerate dehydrogenase